MSKRNRKNNKNRKTYKPVPVAPQDEYQDDYQDYEGEDLNDGSHFGPYNYHKDRPILNYDFFNAYLEYRELEKRYSTKSIIETAGLDNYELYKLKMNYPLNRRERNKIKKSSELSKETDNLLKKGKLELGCLMIFAAVFICIVFVSLFIEIIKNISDDSLAPIVGLFMFLLETGTIFLLVMLLKWFRNRKNFNRLKDEFDNNKKTIGDNTPNVHPYYRLCNNLVIMEDRDINLLYPTKTIDEKYRKFKSYIEDEWRITSHKFITNRFFRMKAFDCHFPNYTHYRFFVEVKYEDCFPDYPELINIEKQLEFLPFIPKDDIRPKASLANYKSMLKKRVTELINERIPKMIVREVVVAAGCTSHNTVHRGKKSKATAKKPFFMESELEKDNSIILKNEFYEHLEDNNLLKKQ